MFTLLQLIAFFLSCIVNRSFPCGVEGMSKDISWMKTGDCALLYPPIGEKVETSLMQTDKEL